MTKEIESRGRVQFVKSVFWEDRPKRTRDGIDINRRDDSPRVSRRLTWEDFYSTWAPPWTCQFWVSETNPVCMDAHFGRKKLSRWVWLKYLVKDPGDGVRFSNFFTPRELGNYEETENQVLIKVVQSQNIRNHKIQVRKNISANMNAGTITENQLQLKKTLVVPWWQRVLKISGMSSTIRFVMFQGTMWQTF